MGVAPVTCANVRLAGAKNKAAAVALRAATRYGDLTITLSRVRVMRKAGGLSEKVA
jgi:hypothetical protein